MELTAYEKMNKEIQDIIDGIWTEHPIDLSVRTGLIVAQSVILKHMSEIRKEIYDKTTNIFN